MKKLYFLPFIALFFACAEKNNTSNEMLIGAFQTSISYNQNQIDQYLQEFPPESNYKYQGEINKLRSKTNSYLDFLDKIISDIEDKTKSRENLNNRDIINSYFFGENNFDKSFTKELEQYDNSLQKLEKSNENFKRATYIFHSSPILNSKAEKIQYVEYHFKNKTPIEALLYLYYLKSQALIIEKDFIFQCLIKSTANNG
ncbi:hypothetical protein [Salegentibacter chungangensis]|uniref:Gliding motility-associated protein GldM N-terminal domain-containing protein n=1 Tax=Salegentibacter chungangensis TaxID=1335724 RepID=A0ABW3NUR7_9FLAO